MLLFAFEFIELLVVPDWPTSGPLGDSGDRKPLAAFA